MPGWWVGVSVMITSALVLLGQELRPVLENSLRQGPGPEVDNNIFWSKSLAMTVHPTVCKYIHNYSNISPGWIQGCILTIGSMPYSSENDQPD